MIKKKKISIIGGAGHIGLPLAVVLFDAGFEINIVDKDKKNISLINKGISPFYEDGLKQKLKKIYKNKKFKVSSNLKTIYDSNFIFICVGTPVNSDLQPDLSNFFSLLGSLKKNLRKSSNLIIRSSIAPGIFKKIFNLFNKDKKISNISYCPERVLQGKSLKELNEIPQIISSYDLKSSIVVDKLFRKICKKTIRCKPEEAEMIKIMSNAFRYINFSISNEFYRICDENNLNFEKIRRMMRMNYSRAGGLASPGFVGGPCLMKDTMQLNYYDKRNNNILQHSFQINEKLPNYIAKKIKNLKINNKKVFILGKSFKPNNDDLRGSLTLNLMKILKKMNIKYNVYDPHVKKISKLELKKLIKNSNIFVLATGHNEFKKLKIPSNKYLIDMSGFYLKY